MKKIMTVICAMLVTAGAAAQNNNGGNNADLKISATTGRYMRLKAKQDTLTLMQQDNGEVVGKIPQSNTPLYLIKMPDNKLIPTTIDTIRVELVKSITVFKAKEACEQFAEYGDISNGVVIVEIKGADLTFRVNAPKDYMRLKVKQDSLTFTRNEETERWATFTPVSNTGTPLYLITTGDNEELKSVSIDTVEQKQIESISVFHAPSAGKFASYGDTSHGVVIVKVKKDK